MSDIVERLRELARNYADGVAGMEPQDHFAWDAAAEIERLRALHRPDNMQCADLIIKEKDAEIERLQLQCSQWEITVNQKDDEIERLKQHFSKLNLKDTETNRQLRDEIERLQRELNAAITAKGSCELEIERLHATLKECADDLEAELRVRHMPESGYATSQRRFDRDMAPVVTARKLLGEVLPQKGS